MTSDSIFKERKSTFNDLFKSRMAILTSICKSDELNAVWAIRVTEHEKAILMIDDVFIQNRIRSVMFIGEVEH